MRTSVLLALVASSAVSAHDHHDAEIPKGKATTSEPMDSILWWHIFFMIASFGVMFPIGMVFGIVRSRWHVPLQLISTIVAIVGVFLGHAHKGRQFATNVHSAFANTVLWMLGIQVVLGIYLKLHLERGIHAKIRPWMVVVHGIAGKAMPVVSWTQMLFGGITAQGFCRADHFGQCIAHFVMGSAFIGYGIVLTLMLLVGQAWLKRTGKSQEFWDSMVIAAWGCVNTFTEHRWGQEWNHGDIQHTSMGVVWWCAGLLGLWLSRGRGGEPKRNVIPALVIFLTGWAMSGHAQHLPLSTMVHASFGYTLMAAGVARIIEICFVLKDGATPEEPSSFQHLTPMLLFASGFIFMAANEEQLLMISHAGIDHLSYLIVLYSVAFLLYLFVQILIYFYVTGYEARMARMKPDFPLEDGLANGERGRAQAADEFELQGLISDDESETSDEHARKP